MTPIPVTRTPVRLTPDPHRVITKPFLPGEQIFPDGQSRVELIIKRILAMPEEEVASTLAGTRTVSRTGTKISPAFSRATSRWLPATLRTQWISPRNDGLLIGAYFTHEYSIEAASLSNPSIVPAPDQSRAWIQGEQRFFMSLRAIGEGHISSIEFRAGVINARGKIRWTSASRYVTTARHRSPIYDKPVLSTKLEELGAFNDITRMCLDPLPALHVRATRSRDRGCRPARRGSCHRLSDNQGHPLAASSNYASTFPTDSAISERVIFPQDLPRAKGWKTPASCVSLMTTEPWSITPPTPCSTGSKSFRNS